MIRQRIQRLAHRMDADLRQNILPFWLRLEDRLYGGHFGLVDADGRVDIDAPKSTVFVSRLLWTLSAVSAHAEREACLAQAEHTRRFLLDRLRDADGAFFWSASRAGRPLDTDKHVYAQAFAIYALSTHARAAGNAESLAAAKHVFDLIETRAKDPAAGYSEAFDLRWEPVENGRLGCGEIGARTSNTHLHLIEAYASLVRTWPDPAPRAALENLLRLFLGHFLAGDGTHSHAFLDSQLRRLPGPISYGHDVEASWLLMDAADTLAEPTLRTELIPATNALCAAAAAGGQCEDGGWITQRTAGSEPDTRRVWWVQAEAAIGLVDAALRMDDPRLMSRAEATWDFIDRAVIDRVHGEWHQRVDRLGCADPTQYKVGPWKDPYHQVRACLEIARRAA